MSEERSRHERLWAAHLAGQPLAPDDRQELARALDGATFRRFAVEDAATEGVLAALGRAHRDSRAFANAVVAVIRAEATRDPFVAEVTAKLRKRRRSRARWSGAAALLGTGIALAFALRETRERPPRMADAPASSRSDARESRAQPERSTFRRAREEVRTPTLHAALAAAPPGVLRRLRAWAPDEDGMYLFNQAGFQCSAHQRFGLETMMLGAVRRDPRAVEEGWHVVDATFARQDPAGHFGDPPNCVATWLAWTGSALLVLEESRFGEAYRARIRALEPALRRAAVWLAAPEQVAALRTPRVDYGDPTLAAAAALALAAARLGDAHLLPAAEVLADHGLAQQRADGAFLHEGTHDTGFHAVQLISLHWLMAAPGGSRFRAPARAAAGWLLGRVGPDGVLDVRGNAHSLPEAREYLHGRETRWALALHAGRFDRGVFAIVQSLRTPE